MRTIKFRAWNNKKEMMHDSDSQIGGLWSVEFINGSPEYYNPDDNMVLMQYTGLKDKNEKEIYEGDYVVMDVWNGGDGYEEPNEIDEFEGIVTWNINGFNISTKDKDGKFEPEMCLCENNVYTKTEVLGNIYENPELLK